MATSDKCSDCGASPGELHGSRCTFPAAKIPHGFECPTTAEVEYAYTVIALDYVYGLFPQRPRTLKGFRRRVLECLEIAMDDVSWMRDSEYERILGELRELFLRFGGTPEELEHEAEGG